MMQFLLAKPEKSIVDQGHRIQNPS